MDNYNKRRIRRLGYNPKCSCCNMFLKRGGRNRKILNRLMRAEVKRDTIKEIKLFSEAKETEVK